jgi:cytochrome b561
MDNDTGRYDTVAIILHWAMAVLVLFMIGFGWYMVQIPEGPARSAPFALHKSIGLTIFLLWVVRILWRFTHPAPPLPESMPGFKRTLARATHVLLYIMLLLQPLSGYLSSSFSGYKTRYFGIPLPHWGWKDSALNEFFTELHVIFSITLVLLIITHVVGAFTHLLTKDDHILRRMLPW